MSTWEIDPSSEHELLTCIVDEQGDIVVMVPTEHPSGRKAAHMVQAAPEMLRALESCPIFCDGAEGAHRIALWYSTVAYPAILRARGEA